jgi:ABC-type multidrug transport system ATPase subunit
VSGSLALVAHDLSKSYGNLAALEPLDLVVHHGEQVALVGHNGSGKTTLLRIAAGLLEPTGGEIQMVGAPAGSLAARAATSYLADNPVLYDDLSLSEHIEYTCRLHGAEEWEERAVELMGLMGLTERADDLPSRFSRGLRQKTAIVLAFVRPFEVLLVDEPFVGLDPSGRESLVGLLDEARAGGVAVIVATHQLDYVTHASRCVALRDGAVIYDGPPDHVDVGGLVG